MSEESTRLADRWQRLRSVIGRRLEGRFLAVGIGMAFALVLLLIVLIPLNPAASQHLTKLSILHIISGRAAGISYGYMIWPQGSWIVIPINIYLETFIVLIAYPLFVFSIEKLVILKWLQQQAEPLREAALRHRKWVQRFGIIGLFCFVWLPFWMTGPLVGCMIGYLLHFNAWLNLSVVLSGTYIAIFCWAFFLQALQEKLQHYSAYAPVVIVVAVVLFTLGLHLLHRYRESRDPK